MVRYDQAGRGAPWTVLRAPPAGLAPWIELSWTQAIPPARAASWRIVADAAPHVLVQRLRRDGATRVRLVGARTRWIDAPAAERSWTAGVRLRPGALPALLGVEPAPLTDDGRALDDVLGIRGRRLEERLADAATASDALALLLGFLERRAASAHARDPRVQGLLARLDFHANGERLGDLAHDLGCAGRTLRQACADHVGLSPVRIARIARLHRSLEAWLRRPRSRGSELAARAGYADQSHMIRDFRALLGETPETFFGRGRRGRG